MIVVGIDPSYARTGVATTGDCRSITPPGRTADLPPLARAATRRAHIRGKLGPLIRGAHIIAIEGMYPTLEYGAIDRAELLGTIVDLALQATDAAVLVVAPASPKILATGNGGPGTDKTAMLAAAHLAGSPAANADEADAWFIAQIAELVTDPTAYRAGRLRYAGHQLRALDPYRPPWTPRHPDPWIRHLGTP